jgi:hypothetical protein
MTSRHQVAGALIAALQLCACGEVGEETASPTDTYSCDAEISVVEVCSCPLTVSWEGTGYPVEEVFVAFSDLSADQLQQAFCMDEFGDEHLTDTVIYEVADGEEMVVIDQLSGPALIYWEYGTVVYRDALIARPTADGATDVVYFSYLH